MTILSILVSSTVFAANFDKRETVIELVQKLEATDPNIKSHQDDWLKVRQHLEQAAQQSESEAGLKLSVQHILDQWGGLRFRVVDRTDAQYWALTGEELALPDAWFAARGSKWVVQYTENPKLRRGDAVAASNFAPYAKAAQSEASWNLSVQSRLMADPHAVALPLKREPLSQWALDLTQSASAKVVIDGKRVCLEKVWLWLTPQVAENIASKIKSAKDGCQALLIDVRDGFGEGLASWPKAGKDIPIAVLANHNTREGAVTLVRSLKVGSKAKVFGEDTDSDRPLQSKDKLSKAEWQLLVTGDNGQVRADVPLRDSYVNAEGVDDIREAALDWIKKELK